jgi:hypothetical protein
MGNSGRGVSYPAPGEGSVSLLDDAVDELYALDLDRFIGRRGELAKAARADGDKEAATAIGALRKPTQSAFTINRLARTDPGAIDALVDLGTALQRAQTAGDAKELRELNTRRRSLLDRLTRQAFDIIGQQSPTAGQREEVTATLTAALADTGVADQLRQGILVRAAESSGFGFSPPELTLIRSPRPAAAPAGPREATASAGRIRASSGGVEAPTTESGATSSGDGAAIPDDGARGKTADRQSAKDTADREKAAKEQAARDRAAREQAARDRAVAAAQADADVADTAVQDAVDRADAAQQLITRLQRELSTARRALDEAQKQTKVAEQKQKAARAALNKVRG